LKIGNHTIRKWRVEESGERKDHAVPARNIGVLNEHSLRERFVTDIDWFSKDHAVCTILHHFEQHFGSAVCIPDNGFMVADRR